MGGAFHIERESDSPVWPPVKSHVLRARLYNVFLCKFSLSRPVGQKVLEEGCTAPILLAPDGREHSS